MSTWSRTLQFIYDYGQLYLYDGAYELRGDGSDFLDSLAEANRKRLSIGTTGGFVNLLMPDQFNYEAALLIDGWDEAPPADHDDWEHVVEFDLDVPSGRLILEASGGSGQTEVEIPEGRYRARWAGRDLPGTTPDEEPSDRYRLQLWPSAGAADPMELKRWWGYDVPGRWPPAA